MFTKTKLALASAITLVGAFLADHGSELLHLVHIAANSSRPTPAISIPAPSLDLRPSPTGLPTLVLTGR